MTHFMTKIIGPRGYDRDVPALQLWEHADANDHVDDERQGPNCVRCGENLEAKTAMENYAIARLVGTYALGGIVRQGLVGDFAGVN